VKEIKPPSKPNEKEKEEEKEEIVLNPPEQKINPIQEYFTKTEGNKGNELFRVTEKNVDIKTELNEREIKLINTLYANDIILLRKGLKPIFSIYYNKFMRLKISFNRKGRAEYVQINKSPSSDDVLENASNLNSILGSKK
jgi:hypothetical protein